MRTVVVLGSLVTFASSAQAQLTGTVVDGGGRALPFAVVVSRTGNGFLATRTDLDGRFAYPGRPHGPGHRIEASSAGFVGSTLQLEGGETDVRLTLLPGGSPGRGWMLGLPVRPTIRLEDASGAPVEADRVVAGREYRLAITIRATHCTRASDWAVETRGGELVVAIAAFTRLGSCGDPEVGLSITHRFVQPGAVVIRVVGRTQDARLAVTVVNP